MKRSLTKAEILRRRRDIAHVFAGKNVYRINGLHLRMVPNDLQWSRVLFATTRAFHNSVERNRARRLVREAYRLSKALMTGSGHHDIAFVLYPGNFTFAERCDQVEKLLRRAGLVSVAADE